ncbi:MAG: hypothetical protein WCF90_03450 [Methanomicrobiales archaeon]
MACKYPHGVENRGLPEPDRYGMIASIFILFVAIQKGFPQKQVAPQIHLEILIAPPIIPVYVLATSGFSAATLVTFLYFFACISLAITGLNHSLMSYQKILIGICLFALAFMIYPLRELFFTTSLFQLVIGTFVSAGVSLMVIRLLSISPQ